ncbi:MAG: SAM-dependent chlorinase/fluorinase [Isosphaeraceae bacterium]|nr:SAM-dependent chlorinase/fluorinase [Isosphaeraceae bacterium]
MIITLLTDFGYQGPYVAAMKGVILSRVPGATLVDLTHVITPQNVLEGAFVLAGIHDCFPEGTIHLAVVDPGVGTDRRLVAARVDARWYVLPDNGLLSGVLATHEAEAVYLIDNPSIRRPRVSNTFHGRDILAPAAAHLASGGAASSLGPKVETLTTLEMYRPAEDGNDVIGEVIFRDSFGNLVTNVTRDHIGQGRPTITIKGATVSRFVRTYADAPEGELVALEGSSGWIEVAVVNGDAAQRLDAGPGTTVRFRRETRS